MGTNMVPLKDLVPDETKTVTLNLLKTMDLNDAQNEKNRGQIILELTYKPFKEDNLPKELFDEADKVEKPPDTPDGGGLLVVIVHEAQDLEGKHHTNPYVKIIFRGEERKTEVMCCGFLISLISLFSSVVVDFDLFKFGFLLFNLLASIRFQIKEWWNRIIFRVT
jgi:hypothetical protein